MGKAEYESVIPGTNYLLAIEGITDTYVHRSCVSKLHTTLFARKHKNGKAEYESLMPGTV